MSDVEFRIENEDREGIVAVGSYIGDAVTRMGGTFDGPCQDEDGHECAVHIIEGAEYLSPPTKAEREHLSQPDAGKDERLACQAKIVKAGRVVVMTKQKKKAEEKAESEERSEDFKKEFAEMPLEKKIASLVQLEVMALGETISFVMNSPFSLGEKIMDVMAEFGFKMERDSKNSRRPEEHRSENGSADKSDSETDKDKPKEESVN